MARATESQYFPSISRCLIGEAHLLSWTSCLETLEDPNHDATNDTVLEAFLSDPQSISRLTHPFEPSKDPSAASKAFLESQIQAAIASPPGSAAPLKEVLQSEFKEDAEWLSKKFNLDHGAALRLVVLEYLGRPTVNLNQQAREGLGDSLDSGADPIGSGSSALWTSANHSHSEDRNLQSSRTARRNQLVQLSFVERVSLIRCSTLLSQAGLNRDAASMRSTWVEKVGRTVVNAHAKGAEYDKSGRHFLVECTDAVLRRAGELQEGPPLQPGDDGFSDVSDVEWVCCQLQQMLAILDLMYVLVENITELLPSPVVLSWFRCLADTGFFELYPTDNRLVAYHFLQLQSQSAILSLAILKLDICLDLMFSAPSHDDRKPSSEPYYTAEAAAVELTEILAAAAERRSSVASLALFAWAILLQSMRDAVSMQSDPDNMYKGSERTSTRLDDCLEPPGLRELMLPTPYNDCLNAIRKILPDRDIIGELAAIAVQAIGVYEVISSLAVDFCSKHIVAASRDYPTCMKIEMLKLISASLDYVEYLPEIIQGCLACLQVDAQRQAASREQRTIGDMMLQDPGLRVKLLERARQRFPYEKSPFLQLTAAIASIVAKSPDVLQSLLSILTNARTFAERIPASFTGYELTDEGDELGTVILTDELVLSLGSASQKLLLPLTTKESQRRPSPQGGSPMIIPAGSTGHVMSLSKPLMVAWNYEYSVLKYLGLLLDTSGSDLESDLTTCLETISLLNALLKAAITQEGSNPTSEQVIDPVSILDEFGSLLPGSHHVGETILKLADQGIQYLLREPSAASEDVEELLAQCLLFAALLLEVAPELIWPRLADGFLIGSTSKTSTLLEVFVSRSSTLVRPVLLHSTIRLYQALIDDIIRRSAPCKTSSQVMTSRWLDITTPARPQRSRNTVTSDQIRSDVLCSTTHTLTDIAAALGDLARLDRETILLSTARIMDCFLRLLKFGFGIGISTGQFNSLGKALGSSAQMIKLRYIGETAITPAAHQLLHLLGQTLESEVEPPNELVDAAISDVRSSALRLLQFLVKLESQQENVPLSNAIGQMFAVLAALYTSSQKLRVPTIELIVNLAIWDERSMDNTKSAFGRFRERDAADFIAQLSIFDCPRGDIELRTILWRFFETLVGCQAQWFASLLLTGSPASVKLRRKKDDAGSHLGSLRSIWSLALTKLASSDCSLDEEPYILGFVVSAASERPWALREFVKQADLKAVLRKRLGAYLRELVTSHGSDQATAVHRIHLLQACTHLFDIFAMDLHYSWQRGDKAAVSLIKSELTKYDYDSLNRGEYSISLHANLKRNFEARFPGLSPAYFQRTAQNQTDLGDDFYYDIELATQVLGADTSWTAYNGFLDSFSRANLNYSAVQAQLYLNNSWLRLTTQLTDPSLEDSELFGIAIDMVCKSLAAGSQNQEGEAVFQALRKTQQRIALTNLQRLDQIPLSSAQAPRLLTVAWSALRGPLLLEANCTEGDLEAHRFAMQSLIFAIRIQLRYQRSSASGSKMQEKRMRVNDEDSVGLIGCHIIEEVALKAIKRTVTSLHEEHPRALREEVGLIVVLLQTALKLEGMEQYYGSLSQTTVAQDVLRTIANLFSWSRNIDKDGSPIFGQYCSRLLLEMSSIPQLAEQIAVQGILGLLANASLMNAVRQGISALRSPLVFSIWVDDIIPILLNVISAVGKPVAQEVISFLNQFQPQLEGSLGLWRDPEHITRGQVKESHLIIMLGKIFDSFGLNGALALQLDTQQMTSGLLFLLEGRKTGLKGRVVPTKPEELAMAQTEGSGGMNRLESQVYNELLEIRLLAFGNDGGREEGSRRSLRASSLRA